MAGGASGELAVLPARRIVLATHHMQAADRARCIVEFDVGTPARHARGDRDAARAAGAGHDGGFLGGMQGVQHLVIDAALRKHA